MKSPRASRRSKERSEWNFPERTYVLAFERTLQCFKEEAALRSSERMRNIDTDCENNFEQNPKTHIKEATRVLGLNDGTIWKILRKNIR